MRGFVEIDNKSFREGIETFKKNKIDVDWAIPRMISDAITFGYNRVHAYGTSAGFKRDGLYLRNIQMQTMGGGRDTEGTIGNAAKDPRSGYRYPEGIEFGTLPHIIRVKPPKRALHFFLKDGTEVFAVRVNHPGTKGLFIYRRAAEDIHKELPAFALNIVERDRARRKL